jgi:hypothetical protein
MFSGPVMVKSSSKDLTHFVDLADINCVLTATRGFIGGGYVPASA